MRVAVLVVTVAAALIVPCVSTAQSLQTLTIESQVDAIRGPQTTGPPGPTPPNQPPRDNSTKTGTAVIKGRVVSAENGQALRRAQVRLMSPELRENRLATTDADGRYEVKELPAGRYNITASKGSFVTLSYGQRRPFEAGRPLEVLNAQTIEKVDFVLPRGSVITGRVLDEFGEPVSDAQVTPLRSQFIGGRRRLSPVAGPTSGRPSMTNDIGEFRLFGLSPGQYYLSATLRSLGPPNAATDDREGYSPTYFPGTANQSEAQRLTVGLGQQVTDVQIVLVPSRMSRVKGTAVDSSGKPLTGMIMVGQRDAGMGMMIGPGTQVKPDGSFELSGLAPGEYTLMAGSNMFPPRPDGESATATITVSGSDISDVRLVGVSPSTITGRLIVDPALARSLTVSQLRVVATPARPDLGPPIGIGPPSPVNENFTFELKARAGEWRLVVQGAPGIAVKSVRQTGVDVTDPGVSVRTGEDTSGIEIELTNRLTDVSGLVTNARGETSKDYSLVVFSRDQERWQYPRYQRTARPDQDGRFKIGGLPPGSYHAIAVDYLEPGESNDPEVLERLRTTATSFTLNDGETKVLDLKLSATP